MIKTGEKYGRLTVMEEAGLTSYGRKQFECLCSCGKKFISESSNIERGHTKSCGCLRDDLQFKHGMSKSKEFMVWATMLQRCTNPKNKKYKNYGGRGISVCERWKESFATFFEDMGKRPKGYSIERINNNGNYEPSNCKWATHKEQMSNMRSNHNITYNSETHLIAEWERKLGFKAGTVKARIYQGWSIKKSLLQPVRKTNRWCSQELNKG